MFQGELNSIVASNGRQLTPAGLNATTAVGTVLPFEITVVGSLTETVTNANAGSPPRVIYRLANAQTGAFVEVYYDGDVNANPLAGTGYNDGTLILRGTPATTISDVGTLVLTNPQPVPPPNFDSFSTNDYATAGPNNSNIASLAAMGGTKLGITVTFVDPAFFVTPGAGDTGSRVKVGDIISLDISQAAPFDKVDPSRKFTDTANSGTGAGPTPSATPRVGAVNGSSGPDFQTQSLMAAAVRPASPTPTPSTTPTVTPTVTPSPTVSPTATPSGTPTGDKVVITANKTQVKEGNDVVITFKFRGPTTHPAITVNYSVGGNAELNVDYTLSGTPGQVVIPANTESASITLHAIDDSMRETDGEAAKVFVEAGSGYDVPDQKDAKRVSVLIVDG